MADYKAVKIDKGPGGWGGPLTIKPTSDRPYIYSVTGGGIQIGEHTSELQSR